jgi:hypothetical protein
MKTPEEIANHPKARLHREIVARLRESGSVKGAEQSWRLFQRNPRVWKRILTFGLALPDRQAKLNKVAFPDSNQCQVDAALEAGNNLNRLHDLACGRASIATDSAGHYKTGAKGLKTIRTAIASRPPGRKLGRGRGTAESQS